MTKPSIEEDILKNLYWFVKNGETIFQIEKNVLIEFIEKNKKIYYCQSCSKRYFADPKTMTKKIIFNGEGIEISGFNNLKEYEKYIRQQVIEEVLACVPEETDLVEDASNTNWRRGYRKAISDFIQSIKKIK